MQDFEKLGAFYLGRIHDPERGGGTEDLLLYDAKDLTTHAVCVGMTGSGKTGLCISLLEEAAIDGIPSLVIDPKGDLANLLLTFPGLSAAEFRPWVDETEAARGGMTLDEYAAKVAAKWREGLASWGQDGARIERLRSSVDMAVYTPGSTSGLPLAVLRSFAAPARAVLDDADALRERVLAAASGLLALVGVDADPIRSREHILLSNLLERAWREGSSLDVADLIRQIQSPPFDRIGVMDVESFYPARERFALAMLLNNLLASPGFAAWTEGEPLDVTRLLWTPQGKPRVSVLSIAHLSDAERMFFVTVLLNEVVSWMRAQPGTPSLRAILYMDEIFGFFPPTAKPPSKLPLLTLMKQARAFGLGVVLATQNPVDLDYKGLSNAGTWFLGRLQTERDKARVIEGLEGASATAGAAFDRKELEATLARLGSRVFLMNNVHDDRPVLFETRWAMSYLRGPLTRAQIQSLMDSRRQTALPAAVPGGTPPAQTVPSDSGPRPVLPPDVPERFLPRRGDLPAGGALVYRPALLGTARVHYVSSKAGVDAWQELCLLAPLEDPLSETPWEDASETEPPELLDAPVEPARFSPLPSEAAQPRSYASWAKDLAGHLYRTRELSLWKCAALKETSKPGESEGDFRIRLAQAAREMRDLEIEKLRKRYAPKLASLQERIRRAEERAERERAQYSQQKMQTAISLGATLLGALFGRKVVSAGSVGRATTTARGMGRAMKEKGDIGRAEENIEALRGKLAELEQGFDEETTLLEDSAEPARLELEEIRVQPRKSDIAVEGVLLAWRGGPA